MMPGTRVHPSALARENRTSKTELYWPELAAMTVWLAKALSSDCLEGWARALICVKQLPINGYLLSSKKLQLCPKGLSASHTRVSHILW